MSEPTLSVREAADRLAVTGETVREWIRNEFLPGAYQKTPGRKTSGFRIPESSVVAIERLRENPSLILDRLAAQSLVHIEQVDEVLGIDEIS